MKNVKKLVKKAFGLILGISIFCGGYALGNVNFSETATTMEAEKITYTNLNSSSPTEYSPSGNEIYELSDGSYLLKNVKNNTFEFQPIEMNDWSVENLDELQGQSIVESYIESKNNLKEEQKNSIKEVDSFQIGGTRLVIYSDGSYSMSTPKEKSYEFYPIELGGWGYHSDNEETFNKHLLTYISNKNSK